MRQRPSSRLLIVDDQLRVLLFQYVHKSGPLKGQDFWSTPGGGVEDGETFKEAAIRELREKTGIVRDSVSEPVAERDVVFQMPDGDYVRSLEKYFLISVGEATLSRDGWSKPEIDVIADHRWWTADELTQTSETVWPEKLVEMLAAAALLRP
jgi:8-oxo-dGTP pyrophosphatase MutT (NUDIX family)